MNDKDEIPSTEVADRSPSQFYVLIDAILKEAEGCVKSTHGGNCPADSLILALCTRLLLKQQRDLADSQELCDELAEALKQCFYHLGSEIKRLPLNESAASGAQTLSRDVAEILDRHAAAKAERGKE